MYHTSAWNNNCGEDCSSTLNGRWIRGRRGCFLPSILINHMQLILNLSSKHNWGEDCSKRGGWPNGSTLNGGWMRGRRGCFLPSILINHMQLILNLSSKHNWGEDCSKRVGWQNSSTLKGGGWEEDGDVFSHRFYSIFKT